MTHDLFSKLAPIIDEHKLKKLWGLYLIESDAGRKEIERSLRLLAEKNLGISYVEEPILLQPPSKEQSTGQFLLGDVCYGEERRYPFGLREDELTSHVGIFGRTGSGKTSLVMLILWQFASCHYPFLVFDWKGEYARFAAMRKDVKIFRADGSSSTFRFNPIKPPAGLGKEDYQNYLKDVISILVTAYFPKMSLLSLEGVKYLLLETLHTLCHRMKSYNGEEYPTFSQILESLQPPKRSLAYAYSALQSCLQSLSFGATQKIFNATNPISLEKLFQSHTILELQRCGSEADKLFLTNAIFYWLYTWRMRQGESKRLRHILVMEEAHHHQGELLERIFRMVRAFGQSLIFVDQHPSLISVPILGNMYTTISLNLKHGQDIDAAATSMGLDDEQKEYLGQIVPGQAIVKLQGRFLRPFLVHVPKLQLPEKPALPAIQEKKELPTIQLSPMQMKFLKHILDHPELFTIQRHEALSLSAQKATSIQKQLLQHELIKKIVQKSKTGRKNFFSVTPQGRKILEKHGISANRTRRHGGPTHQHAVNEIITKLKSKGYRVEKEYHIGNGKKVDILLFYEGQKIAIEVETGSSDIPANIKKCRDAGYPVIIVVLDKKTEHEVLSYLEQQGISQREVKVVRL